MSRVSTVIRSIASREHRSLCGLVAGLLPHLKWRHNGLGLLQAYVHEGTTHEQRVHVWHWPLKRPGIEDSGLLHDHRFDLESTVLVGKLSQVEYTLAPFDDGDWQLHSVVPARKALAISGEPNGLVEALPQRYIAGTTKLTVNAGEAYTFPKFKFHGTHTDSTLVVTLVEKKNQEDAQARILAPYGKPVVHAFADPYQEAMWQPVLLAARDALLARWAT